MTPVAACSDGSTKTTCGVNSSDYQTIPSLYLNSTGQFFDQIVLHSIDDTVFGLTVSVIHNSETIWEHRITDVKNIHSLDLHEEALAHYPVKLVSTFSYNGESAALFHVQYMFPVVNQFIIVESRLTISGKPKHILYFNLPENQASFAPYMSKIKFLVVDDVPPRPANFIDPTKHAWMKSMSYDAFWVDHYQRSIVRDHIDKTSKTIYLCTDADEIPKRELVASFRDEWMYDEVFSRKTIHFAMYMFYYNFNWIMPSLWAHAFAMSTERYLAQEDLVQVK